MCNVGRGAYYVDSLKEVIKRNIVRGDNICGFKY